MPETDRAEEISARLAAATAGPWRNPGHAVVWAGWPGPPLRFVADCGTKAHNNDADLIANAPADLSWLLDQRRELLARVEVADENVRRLRYSVQIRDEHEGDLTRQRDEAEARVEAAERAGAAKATSTFIKSLPCQYCGTELVEGECSWCNS